MKANQYIKILCLLWIIVALIFMFTGVSLATENDLTSKDFELHVGKITPWAGWILWAEWTAVDGANNALTIIIQQLMTFIWGLSLLVMSIGAWFMILHRWDDSSLSKWKDIFMAWVIGLTVALLSYLMVSTLRFLIYSI